MAHQFAGRLALIAFAAAGLQGILALADFHGTIKAALTCGVVFYAFGFIIGTLGGRIAEIAAENEFARLTATPDAQPEPQAN